MDRIIIKCPIEGAEAELQLDKKSMPGESGLCFMITADGCFRGYISRQKNGIFQSIGTPYYTNQDLHVISKYLKEQNL